MVPNMEIGAICDPDPGKAQFVQTEYPGVPFFTDYHRAARQRRGRRGRDLRAALPAPGDRHQRAASEASTPWSRSRPGSTPSRSRSSTRTPPPKPELTFAIMFNQRNNPLYPRSRKSSTTARSATSATPAGSSPPGGVRRATTTRAPGAPPGAAKAAASWSTRPRTSSTCGSGSAAFPQSVYRQGRVRFPPRHRGRGRGDRRGRLRRRRHRDLRHRHPRPGRHRPLRDPRRQRARSWSTTARPPPSPACTSPSASSATRMDMQDVMRLFTGQLDTARLLHHGGHRVRVRLGRTACRCAGELRREHPGRHTADRPGFGRHQRRPTGQRHPPVQLDRQGGPVGLRRGRLPDRAEQADPRGRHLPGALTADDTDTSIGRSAIEPPAISKERHHDHRSDHRVRRRLDDPHRSAGHHGRQWTSWRSATPTHNGSPRLGKKFGVPGFADHLTLLQIGAARRRAHLHPAQPACRPCHRLPAGGRQRDCREAPGAHRFRGRPADPGGRAEHREDRRVFPEPLQHHGPGHARTALLG